MTHAKRLSLIITATLIAALFIFAAFSVFCPIDTAYADDYITLYTDSTIQPFAIIVRPDADEDETKAAQTLCEYLSAITGSEQNVFASDEVDTSSGSYIFVTKISAPDEPAGSYTLRAGKAADKSMTEDKNLYIEANSSRGLFNGVYEYLRVFCGVNVYSHEVKTVPSSNAITVSDNYYFHYTPQLEYAQTDWISPNYGEFSLANGLNGSNSPLTAYQGGHTNYILFCHSLSTSIVPASELFATHPEYYALNKKGERESTQLCLSNPDVIERAKQDVLRLINAGYDPTASLNIISVTQDDNQKYCLCENCNAIAGTYGGQSGLMLWFVNQIADCVLSSPHPDVVVDTFAYQYTRQAPQNIVPRDNVCVRLCSIECCFSHPLEDENCEANVKFMADLKAWSQICSRLYIWDYTTNYSQTIGLFPDFGVLQANIDTFVKYHVVGIYEEGNYYASACNTEFADLRAYLLARYMYDPSNVHGTVSEDTTDGFLKAYYGEGWQEIKEFLQFITAHAGNRKGHLFIYASMKNTMHDVSAKDIRKIDDLWDTAEQKASDAGNTAALKRIQRSRISWEYYSAVNEYGDYTRDLNIGRWSNASARLIDSLTAANVTRYNEGGTMSDLYLYALSNPGEWNSLGILVFYCIGIALLAIMLTIVIVFAVLAITKKRYSLLMIPIITIAVVLLAIWARSLFAHISSTAVGFIAVGILMNLCVGSLLPVAKYAACNFKKTNIKPVVKQWLIGSAISAVPFAILLSVFELFVTDTCPSVPSCLVAYVWYFVLIITATFIVQNKMFLCDKLSKLGKTDK